MAKIPMGTGVVAEGITVNHRTEAADEYGTRIAGLYAAGPDARRSASFKDRSPMCRNK